MSQHPFAAPQSPNPQPGPSLSWPVVKGILIAVGVIVAIGYGIWDFQRREALKKETEAALDAYYSEIGEGKYVEADIPALAEREARLIGQLNEAQRTKVGSKDTRQLRQLFEAQLRYIYHYQQLFSTLREDSFTPLPEGMAAHQTALAKLKGAAEHTRATITELESTFFDKLDKDWVAQLRAERESATMVAQWLGAELALGTALQEARQPWTFTEAGEPRFAVRLSAPLVERITDAWNKAAEQRASLNPAASDAAPVIE